MKNLWVLKNEYIFGKKQQNINVKLSQMMHFRLNQNAWKMGVASALERDKLKITFWRRFFDKPVICNMDLL